MFRGSAFSGICPVALRLILTVVYSTKKNISCHISRTFPFFFFFNLLRYNVYFLKGDGQNLQYI